VTRHLYYLGRQRDDLLHRMEDREHRERVDVHEDLDALDDRLLERDLSSPSPPAWYDRQ
jgi:hypothetical protein